MKKLLFYMHAGSKNHGCEAIVNSLCKILDKDDKPELLTYRANEDKMYTLNDLCILRQERSFKRHFIMHVLLYIYRKITKDAESFIRFRYGYPLSGKKDIYPLAISIGGDNYCYDDMLNDLKLSNSAFTKQGTRTVLLGCSVEPDLLNRKEIKDDIGRYNAIIARESITFGALTDAYGEEKNIYCIPDPAFTLPAKEIELPEGFDDKSIVGINLSPMVEGKESKPGIALESFAEMIEYILKETDMNILLIPHVVWQGNDDRTSLQKLFDRFSDNSDRILMVEDSDCETLKGYIKHCRFFVGARTHSTIAAYSTCVPTLVVGYSVKARGIAKDLFPDFNQEELVLPVQGLKESSDLKKAFIKLMNNEDKIRKHLEEYMPQYIKKAYCVKDIIEDLF